jgi:flagellar basal-body rod protein FlgF
MNNAISVGLSGLMALERRLETVAHNVANTNTVGFRAEAVRFATKLEQAGQTNVAFAARGGEYLNMQQGARISTGNALDVAVSGEAFMAQAGDTGTRAMAAWKFHQKVNCAHLMAIRFWTRAEHRSASMSKVAR